MEKQTDAGGRTQPCRRVGESLEHEDPKLEAHESRVLEREGDEGRDQVLEVICVFPGIHILWDSLTFEKVIRSGGEVTQGWKIVPRRANQFRSFGKTRDFGLEIDGPDSERPLARLRSTRATDQDATGWTCRRLRGDLPPESSALCDVWKPRYRRYRWSLEMGILPYRAGFAASIDDDHSVDSSRTPAAIELKFERDTPNDTRNESTEFGGDRS